MDREGPVFSDVSPLGLGTKGSEAIVLDSLADVLETMAVATCECLFGSSGPTDEEESGWGNHGPSEEVM